MQWVLLVPLAGQAGLMAADEFIYHWRRGLPRWERIGHPLDTVTVLACYAWILFVAPGGAATWTYVALAAVSSLFITKDEFVHARECTRGEQLTHAILFSSHPFVLAAAGLIWPALHGVAGPVDVGTLVVLALYLQMGATVLFLAYQVVYWNLVWTRKPQCAA